MSTCNRPMKCQSTQRNLLADAPLVSLTDATPLPLTALQTETQGLLDYAQAITDTGEELMFTMDVPYVPAQEAPIVLAQAATLAAGSSTQQFDYILKDCQETESGGDTEQAFRSAMRSVDPAGSLAVYLGNRSDRDIYDNSTAMASIKITLLEGTKHGEITTEVDNTGRTSYGYDPVPDYVGKDRAVFMAEFEGKRYKIVIDLRVSVMVNEYKPVCPPPQLIKVKKPASGSSGYDLNSVSVNIADLPGSQVGQTTGTAITLDTNAANYGWFIDPTPADNSEFLPTANPDVWMAKAGTDAAGKMDMLSVLLHEYGHALGMEHSANPNDFMAPDLQPGERRLPTSDELALMSQRVAQLQPNDATASATDSTSPVPDSPSSPTSPTLPIGAALSALFIGRLRRTDYGGWSPVIDSVQIPAPAPQI